MPGYVPPALRNNSKFPHKKLSLKPKPIDWTQLKSSTELMNEYQIENYGKADFAWDSE